MTDITFGSINLNDVTNYAVDANESKPPKRKYNRELVQSAAGGVALGFEEEAETTAHFVVLVFGNVATQKANFDAVQAQRDAAVAAAGTDTPVDLTIAIDPDDPLVWEVVAADWDYDSWELLGGNTLKCVLDLVLTQS